MKNTTSEEQLLAENLGLIRSNEALEGRNRGIGVQRNDLKARLVISEKKGEALRKELRGVKKHRAELKRTVKELRKADKALQSEMFRDNQCLVLKMGGIEQKNESLKRQNAALTRTLMEEDPGLKERLDQAEKRLDLLLISIARPRGGTPLAPS